MLQRRPDLLAGRCLPQPRRLVKAPRQRRLAVGAQGHGQDLVLMLQGGPIGLPVAVSHSRAVLS